MRKFYLLSVSLLLSAFAFAQVAPGPKAFPASNQKQVKAHGSYTRLNSKEIPLAETVGLTNYDLQTNDGVARRLINHGDGTLSTVWTQYHGTTMPAAAERGTGYNYFDGSAWKFASFDGNVRIEGTTRTGWPAIVALDNGNEFVVNHARTAGGYYGWKQVKGTNNTNWTAAPVAQSKALYWPRATSSGNTIHVFGVVDSEVIFNGQKPCPVYIRSTDGGTTWGGLVQPTGITSEFFDGIGGDSYAIDANGEVVAIVVFDLMNDFTLFKSTDGGSTWTKKIIADFPQDLYSWSAGVLIDKDADAVADTCTTVNGADVVVDDNGTVHVAYSTVLVLDDDATDDVASYFYGYNNFIGYWNDDMAAGVYTSGASTTSFHELYVSPEAEDEQWIGYTPDIDGSNVLEITGSGAYGFGGYCGFPSIALDESENVYVSYSATMEGDDYLKTDASPSAQNFKHILISQKVDGMWYFPLDVTSVDGTNAENIYCTLAKNADSKLYMQYQWDGEPGIFMRDDPTGTHDPITDNFILVKGIEVPLPDAIPTSNGAVSLVSAMVYPNPVTDFVNISASGMTKIELYNVSGSLVLSSSKSMINMSNLPTGTYIAKVYTSKGVVAKKIQKN